MQFISGTECSQGKETYELNGYGYSANIRWGANGGLCWKGPWGVSRKRRANDSDLEGVARVQHISSFNKDLQGDRLVVEVLEMNLPVVSFLEYGGTQARGTGFN